jgi:hypothetical protein
MRHSLTLAALCTAATLALGGAVAAADAPPKPVRIETAGAKKAPVAFDHQKHAEAKCEACHHVEHNASGERRCTQCHKLTDDPVTRTPKVESAMHGKGVGVCYGCHRAEKAPRKLKCVDCHKG